MENVPPRKQWADKPMELIVTPQFTTGKSDIFTTAATEMALLHNVIIRGFNSIYIQARHIVSDEREDFLGYCRVWYGLVKSHLDDEDSTLFKKLEELMADQNLFTINRAERETFVPALTEFNLYISSLPAPEDFAAVKLMRILDSLREPFEHHLHAEVTTITALISHPRAPIEGTSQFKTARNTISSWSKTTVSKAGVWDVVPFFLLHHDKTSENGKWSAWPNMPVGVKWGAANVTSNWHAGLWVFSCCDYNGLPQELHALKTTGFRG